MPTVGADIVFAANSWTVYVDRRLSQVPGDRQHMSSHRGLSTTPGRIRSSCLSLGPARARDTWRPWLVGEELPPLVRRRGIPIAREAAAPHDRVFERIGSAPARLARHQQAGAEGIRGTGFVGVLDTPPGGPHPHGHRGPAAAHVPGVHREGDPRLAQVVAAGLNPGDRPVEGEGSLAQVRRSWLECAGRGAVVR